MILYSVFDSHGEKMLINGDKVRKIRFDEHNVIFEGFGEVFTSPVEEDEIDTPIDKVLFNRIVEL